MFRRACNLISEPLARGNTRIKHPRCVPRRIENCVKKDPSLRSVCSGEGRLCSRGNAAGRTRLKTRSNKRRRCPRDGRRGDGGGYRPVRRFTDDLNNIKMLNKSGLVYTYIAARASVSVYSPAIEIPRNYTGLLSSFRLRELLPRV